MHLVNALLLNLEPMSYFFTPGRFQKTRQKYATDLKLLGRDQIATFSLSSPFYKPRFRYITFIADLFCILHL